MISLYKHLIRPVLFTMDAEDAHGAALAFLRVCGVTPLRQLLVRMTRVESAGRECFGLHFPNPIGIAAGFDKNGEALPALAALGFGFLEVGTVTLKPQVGNPRPRITRVPHHRGVINRMGFPGKGAEYVAETLKRYGRLPVPVFINIGKNKDTPNENAADDYTACIRLLHPYADAFVCNVSSPNTTGLRDLQAREPLRILCARLQDELRAIAHETGARKKPLILKIAPDVDEQTLYDMLDVIKEMRVEGITISNTTISRPDNLPAQFADLQGGMSGHDELFEKMRGLVHAAHAFAPDLPIIACGSITNAGRARDILSSGASLVQVYTAMVYEGPFLAKRINEGLQKRNRS